MASQYKKPTIFDMTPGSTQAAGVVHYGRAPRKISGVASVKAAA